MAERKNKHLLEVARALCFSTKVPNYLWGEAILTTTYLINWMPTRILNLKTPLTFFKECFPTSQLFGDIPLQIFGSIAFAHSHDIHCGKLEPKAGKCILLAILQIKKVTSALIQFPKNSLYPWM